MKVLNQKEWGYNAYQASLSDMFAMGGQNIIVDPSCNAVVVADTESGPGIIRNAGKNFAFFHFGPAWESILEAFDKAGIKTANARVLGRTNDLGIGTQFRGVLDVETFQVNTPTRRESITHRLELITSVDGSIATHFLGGGEKVSSIYRQVCSNGMHAWRAESSQMLAQHRSKFKNTTYNRPLIEQALEAFEMEASKTALIHANLQRMANTALPLPKEEAIALAVAATGYSPYRQVQGGTNQTKYLEHAIGVHNQEFGDSAPTVWSAYNAANHIFATEKGGKNVKDLSVGDFTRKMEGLNTWADSAMTLIETQPASVVASRFEQAYGLVYGSQN